MKTLHRNTGKIPPKTKSVSLRIEEDVYEWLSNKAVERRAARGAIIREILLAAKREETGPPGVSLGERARGLELARR